MITTTDIANILYRDFKTLGIEVVPFGKTLSELTGERVTIHVKGQTPTKYWEKCFVEVNLCVPDIRVNEVNTIRLNQLERITKEMYRDVISQYDGTYYEYGYDLGNETNGQITIEADTALKCHFVNCRLLFKVLNTIEL